MTTITTPTPPKNTTMRAYWAVRDCWTIVVQELHHHIRQPSIFAWQLGFPVVMVLLFVYVFGSAMDVTGAGAGEGYLAFAIPGLLAMTMSFGFMNTAVAVAYAKEKGFTDRFRSMPMAPSAFVTGRGVADIIHAAVDLTILILLALALGWRPDNLSGVLAAAAILLWLRLALIWVGVWIGLLVGNSEGANNLFALAFPVGMISSVFTPPSMMPNWLGTIAAWNPVSATATTARDLFGAHSIASDTWIENNAAAASLIWPLIITAIFLPLAIHRWKKLSR
ncbi:ABC transporter permease [Natronoglycomyces albus]|uniref:Transport permease protein n=1 Tax=Natronoglycomyces albus TaxID=2811108 RepID=A0A895XYV5_9ACTN|nr:ABC transporter permease [Natronoglycomyces albus]QSB06788.1 ABC transporter permease [Natronoglycomyces albus]